MFEPATNHVLIVGIGSAYGDDRAGWLAAERLATRLPDLRSVVLRSPSELLDLLKGDEQLIVIDACRGAAAIGSVLRFEWPSSEISRVAFAGTHDMSLEATLSIAATLGQLPSSVSIWTVEIGQAEIGPSELSPEVERGVSELVARVIEELRESLG